MNRKILAILGILVLAVSVSAVSAFGLDDLVGGSSEAQNVTIDGFEFPIPSGFEENVTLDVVDEKASVGGVDYTYCQKAFENDNGDIVSILVADYGEYEVNDEVVSVMGGEKTTINGIEGYISENEGIHIFAYPKEDKLVVITADNENDIDGFVAE